MNHVVLMAVEDTFCLRSDIHPERCVLIVHPNFSVPSSGWKERTETVLILKPDGTKLEVPALISLSHFNIRDPEVSIDQRWRVTISFQGMTSDDLPDGSQILVLPETRDALLQKTEA